MTKLDISSTNVTNRHLLHLVTHAPALKSLNISSNISITDDARMPVAALTKLSSLHLGGTAFTIPGLRLLVYALPPSCELATIPQGCLAYLNDRGQQYAVAIPPGYAQDPRQVPGLTIPALRRNLALHRSCNKRVQIAGNRIELIERLRSILCGRVADRKLANSMCQSRNSNPESMLGNVLRTGKPLENF
ncbi:MAG: hypothetical protein M1817_004214 [Caeruleum heppii]|nr:MAG: hypothetical protein M1817_004214 [Caeruleum heppii]